MTTKTVCNKCGHEKVRSTNVPSITAVTVRNQPAGAEPVPTWLNLRITLSPAYLTQVSLDICPDCCSQLQLPSDGIRPNENSQTAIINALADYVAEAVELEIQNYHD